MTDVSTDLFGPMVRAARKARGWTLEVLCAAALGHRRIATLSEIENQKVSSTSRRVAQALAKVLDLDLAEIERQTAEQANADAQHQAALDLLIHENGSLKKSLDNLTHLAHDGLIALATRFGIADAHRLSESALRAGLADKAEEYASYRIQIERIDERVAGLGNLKAAARDAAERLDFAEVEALLSRVDEVETDIAAQTKELRADNFLLQGRAQQAYDVLTAAADSFASIGRLAPARRRVIYEDRLYRHGLRYGGEGLRLSVLMLKAGSAIVAMGDDPWLWAATQNNLGNALRAQGSRTAGETGAALLAEAVEAYRAALEVYTKAERPLDWAMTQNNLGIALGNQGRRTAGETGAALLAEAVAAFRAALEVRTKADNPLNWATTQNNLGAALQTQGGRTAGEAGAKLLAEAVDAYRGALEVYSKAEHPLDWAMTQNNLGNALQIQGSRTADEAGAQLLAEAVAAYRAALEIRTKADHPLDWAMTQHNLGNALGDQGQRTTSDAGAALLEEAIEAYRAALEVRTKADHPLAWAMTQENLAITEQARARHDSCTDPTAHLGAALAHVTAALDVYDPEHLTYDYQTAVRLRDRITAALTALGR